MNSPNSRIYAATVVTRAVGVLSLALGGLTLFAWHFHLLSLVKWTAVSSPLHYNSAFEFVLIGFVCILCDRKRAGTLATVLCVLIFSIGALTLFEHFAGKNIGIDEVFVPDTLSREPFAPGRISPISCVCSILIAIALLTRLWLPASRCRFLITAIIGSCVFALGITALLSSLSRIPAGYSWGKLAHMPVQSAIAFILIGKATTLNGWLTDSQMKSTGLASLGVPLFSSVLAFTLALFQALHFESRSNQSRAVESLSTRLAVSLQHSVERRVRLMEAMVEENFKIPIDPRILQGILPHHAPEIISILFYKDGHQERSLFRKKVPDTLTTEHSVRVALPGGAAPSKSGTEIIGQLDVHALAKGAVERSLPPDFLAQIEIGHKPIYSNHIPERLLNRRFQFQTSIRIASQEGSVQVVPSTKWSNRTGSLLPPLVLFSGVIIALLVAMLARSKESADRASRTKTLFLANISHELRTPLGIIVGYAALLLDKTVSAEDRTGFTKRIIENGSLLTQIIDDLLDITKVEAGHIQFNDTEFSLHDLFAGIAPGFEVRARQKGISLAFLQEGLLPGRIVTDLTRLRQILINIIGNAVKFTQKGGVTVTVVSQNEVGTSKGRLKVLVQDSGIGLSDGQLGKIFRPFGQGNERLSEQFGGSGLGLALSRQLARKMNGDVVLLKSAPGLGSLFEVSIQYTKSAAASPVDHLFASDPRLAAIDSAQPAPHWTTKSLSAKRILLVEDSKDNQLLFERVLRREGAEVVVAQDGEDGVRKASESAFDLILMDLQMPKLDGYQATAQLRRRKSRIPIIALSAHAMQDEQDRCLRSGFNAYLTKPVDFQTLIDVVKRAIDVRKSPPRIFSQL